MPRSEKITLFPDQRFGPEPSGEMVYPGYSYYKYEEIVGDKCPKCGSVRHNKILKTCTGVSAERFPIVGNTRGRKEKIVSWEQRIVEVYCHTCAQTEKNRTPFPTLFARKISKILGF